MATNENPKRQRTDATAIMQQLQSNSSPIFPIIESVSRHNDQLEEMIYPIELLDPCGVVLWSGDLRQGKQQMLTMDDEWRKSDRVVCLSSVIIMPTSERRDASADWRLATMAMITDERRIINSNPVIIIPMV